MDGTRAIALRIEHLYFVVTQNNPLDVLSGMDTGEKNPFCFSFFRLFLDLCLTCGEWYKKEENCLAVAITYMLQFLAITLKLPLIVATIKGQKCYPWISS